ncbi:MAG: apolipoprotein N-acyltransferase [Methyloceanibacter sp.]
MLSQAPEAMTRAATALAGLRGARRAIAAVALGALSVLAFAPFHVWPVLFATFGALVWMLDGCHAEHARRAQRLRAAATVGFCFGFGYFLAGFYWVAEAFLVEPWRHGWLLPFVMTALPGGMALFFAAAAALAMLLWVPGPGRAFALAIAFFLAEFARGHVLTGLPWNLVGYSLLGSLPLMQLAALFGVYGMSLLALLLFAAPAAIFAPSHSGLARGRGAFALAGLLLILLVAGYGWGERRLQAAGAGDTGLRFRIVQANVDQGEKWRPENSVEIFTDYLELTRSGPMGLEGIAMVVWPETAVPFFLADTPEALAAIANVLPAGATLLVGSGRLVEERDTEGALIRNRVYNSVLAIDDTGHVVAGYDKIHLVPLGEYLPFQDFLESLGMMQLTDVRGGFSVGQGPRLLTIPGAPPATPLICYEIIFPHEITESGTHPGWLLNITNDAWFGSSAGPYQHFHQARVRAVEQGLPVVRAANTGISAMIDPYGRVRAEIGLGRKGIIDADLPKVGQRTLFAQFGIIVDMAMLILAAMGWLACRIVRQDPPSFAPPNYLNG